MDSWSVIFKGAKIAVYTVARYHGNYILLEEPYCLRCAYPGVTTQECTWHWDAYGFERIYAMGAYLSPTMPGGYDDLLSKHIRGLKKYPGYSVPLGLALAECLRKRYPELLEMDLIVPVPLFDTELKVSNGTRYNQSVELSKVLSNEAQIRYEEILEKTKEMRLKNLKRRERRDAVRGLYRVTSGKAARDRRILLVDDISTSGSTASECSLVLKDSGARIVNVLVAGRDKGAYR